MKKIIAALLLLAAPVVAHAAGTANRIPKFSSGTWLSNSTISDDGSIVGSTLPWSLSGGVEVRGSTTSSQFGNTGVGDNACDSVIPNDPVNGIANTCIGYKAGTSITTGYLNTFVGNTAGVFTGAAFGNTAVGHQALYENLTGNSNTAIGYDALVFQDLGDGNTAVGDHALQGTADTVAASHNTAIGYFAGSANNTGQRLTLIGASTVGTDLFNATALGYGATVTASSTTVIGNTSVVTTTLRGNVNGFSTMTFTDGGVHVSGRLFASTASVTVANSASTTTLLGAGVGSLTLPANFFTVGKTLRIRAKGIWGDDAAAPGLVQSFIVVGSTIVTSSQGDLTTGGITNVTNGTWILDVDVTCRSTGASGTVVAVGQFMLANTVAGLGQQIVLHFNGSTPVTLDTTAAQVVDVRWNWATVDAQNTITQVSAVVEGF